jgi:hypothetical protein
VLPPFLRTIRACDRLHRAKLLDLLSRFVQLVNDSIKHYLPEIIELVEVRTYYPLPCLASPVDRSRLPAGPWVAVANRVICLTGRGAGVAGLLD